MRRRPGRRYIDLETPGAPSSPMSAARLQAEAAFGAPPPPSAPAQQAQVIVKRSRAMVPDIGDTTSASTPAAADDKGPRVFRVDTLGSASSMPTDAAATEQQTPLAGAATPMRRRKLRRIAVDKRPSAVVHIVHTPRPREPKPGELDPRLYRLGAELARLQPVLDDITRAQAMRFDADRHGADWSVLAKHLDQLRLELHQLLHQPGPR